MSEEEKCKSCNGIGQVFCGQCNGLGKVICIKCGGSKLIEIKTGERVLEGADAEGKKYMIKQPTFFRGGCDQCGAEGSMMCPNCHGARREPCSVCAGSGKVADA